MIVTGAVFHRWIREKSGAVMIEAAVLFPVVVSLMMAVWDLGNGIAINQKVIASSQVIGDLIARNRSVDINRVNDIVIAGQLALEPYSTAPFGYDIVSIQYEADGDVDVLWRVTHNMAPNEAALESAEGLGEPGEGIVIVTSSYSYDPFFASLITGVIEMEEVAFLRGRISTVIPCNNCPG